jgi:hypothetical protein
MAGTPYTREIDESLRFERPTLRSSGAFVVAVGLGAISLGFEAVIGARTYSREHRLRERLVGRIRGLGNQVMSACGPISRTEDDGAYFPEPNGGVGYVISGLESTETRTQLQTPANTQAIIRATQPGMEA